ncbi:MAG: glutamate 5-kinase, partial [Mucinivorans sp.]
PLDKDRLDEVSSRQVFAAIGQVALMNYYSKLFGSHSVVCGQVLTMKESFSDRGHYLNQKNCIEAMLSVGVLPIINENDTVSVTELMFTDNDELSGLVATMLKVDMLVILSNVNGVFDGPPQDSTSHLIRTVNPSEASIEQYIQNSRSTLGRGGMGTKQRIARGVALQGIEVVVANGHKENILTDIILHNGTLCTRFTPKGKVASSVKRWLSQSESFAKGEIHLNQGAIEALSCPGKATSLLPVGVVRIDGEFRKGDIVRIVGPGGNLFALGKSSVASKDVEALNGRPLVHYDYLYIY